MGMTTMPASKRRTYDDGCAAAHALDLVGERWALLVVRELLLGPKRFTDLKVGLPGASPNVLAQRLRELEGAGVVRRRKLPPPSFAESHLSLSPSNHRRGHPDRASSPRRPPVARSARRRHRPGAREGIPGVRLKWKWSRSGEPVPGDSDMQGGRPPERKFPNIEGLFMYLHK